MPVTTTYPGVYIEEVPSPVRSIPGVSTSVTAFIGYTGKGPLNEPVRCFDFAEFERRFGGLHRDSDLSYAVRQFFDNQGKEAWVVRVAKDAARASVVLQDDGSATSRLKITAKSEGLWGNLLRVIVDYCTPNPESTFNIIVVEFAPGQPAPVRVETHADLTMDANGPRYVVDVLKNKSELVDAERLNAGAPAGGEAWSRSGALDAWPAPAAWTDKRYIAVRVHGMGPFPLDVYNADGTPPTSLWRTAANIQAALTGPGVPALAALTVEVVEENGDVSTAEADADADGVYLRIRGTHATNNERSSVQVLPAANGDATGVLKWTYAAGARERSGSAGLRPAQTGSVTGDLFFLRDGSIPKPQTLVATYRDGGGAPIVGEFDLTGAGALDTPAAIATRLKTKFDGLGTTFPAFKDVVVEVVGSRVRFYPTAGSEHSFIALANKVAPPVGTDRLDTVLGLDRPPARNIREYTPGRGGTLAMQEGTESGADGSEGALEDHMGSGAAKSGIWALEKVGLFNILCIPFLNKLDVDDHATLFGAADAYCERRRAFLVADPPTGLTTPEKAAQWIDTAPKSKNAAVYWPEVKVHDPFGEGKPRTIGASGTMAGLYSRTDVARGVWKAPAGTDAGLNGVLALNYVMTDPENGILNPVAVNALRQFPVYGRIAWGARTLYGGRPSEWKYVPIRRLALFLEESLYQGTQWVVFEPNDEPLWSQIRLNVGAFMHGLYRQGAFQGGSPKDAYFVKCDRSTNPQDEIDRGIVNILVGFAPLKPAEFVIIKISQIAPQAAPA